MTPVIGIQLYAFLDLLRRDPNTTLKRLAAIGYTEVEAAGFSVAEANGLKPLFGAANLICPSVHLPFGRVDLDTALDDACELRAKYAVSPALLPGDFPTDGTEGLHRQLNGLDREDYKRIAGRANHIGERARSRGLRYVYHNHNFEFRDFAEGGCGYSILLDETSPDLVQFEMDCGWASVGGANVAALLERFPNRFALLHVKDFRLAPLKCVQIPADRTAVPLGQGEIDYRGILRRAREIGIQHLVIERDPPVSEGDVLEAAARDFAYLNALLSLVSPSNGSVSSA